MTAHFQRLGNLWEEMLWLMTLARYAFKNLIGRPSQPVALAASKPDKMESTSSKPTVDI